MILAKKRNNSQPSGRTPADAPPTNADPGGGRHDTATRRAPVTKYTGTGIARPADDDDPLDAPDLRDAGDELDQDESERGGDIRLVTDDYDVDEDDHFVVSELPPEVVASDDPELRAFLRAAHGSGDAPLPLADKLREWGDPRDDAVQELCAPRPILPPARYSLWEPFTMVASGQWYARLTSSGVVARAYAGTALHAYLSAYGKPEAVRIHPAGGPTSKSVLDAVEQCRLRLVLTLFGLEAGELEARPDDSPRARVARLARSLRAVGRRAVAHVCRAVRAEPELGRGLSIALSKDRNGRGLWEMVVNTLNPDRRGEVALPAAH